MEKNMFTRRTFLAVAATTATSLLAGCSFENADGSANDAPDQGESSVSDEPAVDTNDGSEAAATGATLVAFFSATGNTEGVASAIAERLGADVFAIEAEQPYTKADLNYNDDASRVSIERADGTNPELVQVTPDGWADCDTVLLGYPIWWGEAAWPLRTFVEGNDFGEKTVVPFCTSGSSEIGSSADGLEELAGSGDWREGERFSAGAGDEAAD